MTPTTLQFTWFLLFGVLIAGYAILDGFDLGIGIASLGNKRSDERRLLINAIAPVWDGNEVWLLTAGGALFAAFAPVYATVFSGFYLAIMILLLAMILRAVAMEFRGKMSTPALTTLWDRLFGIGSILIALLFGVAVGNIVQGIPLDESGEYTGTFLQLLTPYPLSMGLFSVSLFLMHGAIYGAIKTEDQLHTHLLKIARRSWIPTTILFTILSAITLTTLPHIQQGALTPSGILLLIITVALLGVIPLWLGRRQLKAAFLCSSGAVFTIVALIGKGLYPRFVPSVPNLANSLTVAGHSTSETTLRTMLGIALLGMPLVIGYTIFMYRVFKGKVQLDEHSY